MNDVEGREPDTELASDAAVIRTRMSSTTRIEDLDNFGRFIRQQLQTNWSVHVMLSPPPPPHPITRFSHTAGCFLLSSTRYIHQQNIYLERVICI